MFAYFFKLLVLQVITQQLKKDTKKVKLNECDINLYHFKRLTHVLKKSYFYCLWQMLSLYLNALLIF